MESTVYIRAPSSNSNVFLAPGVAISLMILPGVVRAGLVVVSFSALGQGVLVDGVFSELARGVIFARTRFPGPTCGVVSRGSDPAPSGFLLFGFAGVPEDALVDVLPAESLPAS